MLFCSVPLGIGRNQMEASGPHFPQRVKQTKRIKIVSIETIVDAQLDCIQRCCFSLSATTINESDG